MLRSDGLSNSLFHRKVSHSLDEFGLHLENHFKCRSRYRPRRNNMFSFIKSILDYNSNKTGFEAGN